MSNMYRLFVVYLAKNNVANVIHKVFALIKMLNNTLKISNIKRKNETLVTNLRVIKSTKP